MRRTVLFYPNPSHVVLAFHCEKVSPTEDNNNRATPSFAPILPITSSGSYLPSLSIFFSFFLFLLFFFFLGFYFLVKICLNYLIWHSDSYIRVKKFSFLRTPKWFSEESCRIWEFDDWIRTFFCVFLHCSRFEHWINGWSAFVLIYKK